MRGTAVLAAFGLASLAVAQSPGQQSNPEIADLFASVRSQVLIVARQHDLGPQLVEISAVDASYPKDLLESQVDRLAKALESTPRGLVIYEANLDPKSRNLSFLKASFAIDNLVSRTGSVDFAAIHEAFAGAPEPYTVKGLTVVVEGPTAVTQSKKLVANNMYQAQGRLQRNPLQLEYRVRFLTQNPSLITGSQYGGETESTKGRGDRSTRPLGVVILVGLAGLIAGGLVYFFLSRRLSAASK